jgi:hypothetical protein
MFEDLGCKTSLVHGLLGDVVWKGFWQDKAPNVRQTDYVPTAMHNGIKHQVMRQSDKLSGIAGEKEDANVRYDALMSKVA